MYTETVTRVWRRKAFCEIFTSTCGRGFFSLVFFLSFFRFFERLPFSRRPRRYYSIRPLYKCTTVYKRRITCTQNNHFPHSLLRRSPMTERTDRRTQTEWLKSRWTVLPHTEADNRDRCNIYIMKGNLLYIYISILHTHMHDQLAIQYYIVPLTSICICIIYNI